MMEIIPAVMQPPRRVESCLLQCLIPTEQSTSCLRWHFHSKDLTTQNLFFPFPPAEKSSAWWCRGLAVHLCGQAEPAACRWNAALSAAGLKQSYWQQSFYVKAHTLTPQSCSLRTLGIRAAYFSDQKPVFTIVSTAEPWSSGRASWLLFCFAHHQQNCQLISYCRIFITSNDLWGRMNIFYFQISGGSCRLAAGKNRFLTCKLSKYDMEVIENEK